MKFLLVKFQQTFDTAITAQALNRKISTDPDS